MEIIGTRPDNKIFCPYCGSSLAEQKDNKTCNVCLKELEPIQPQPPMVNGSQGPRPSFIAPFNPNQVSNQDVSVMQHFVQVPGAQLVGLVQGVVCHYCPAPAISVCNLQRKNFTGCGKPFCREHGLPHYSSLMIDSNW
jgi:hypothetical protein